MDFSTNCAGTRCPCAKNKEISIYTSHLKKYLHKMDQRPIRKTLKL